MPGGRERAGLGFAVPDHAGGDQIRVVHDHAVGMRQAVAELPAFVDGARGFGRDVAADVAGERELLEELPHPVRILALVRIDLGVRPLQVSRPEDAGRAVSWSGHEDHVEIELDDQPVQVYPDERQRRAGAPVAEQTVLHVLGGQRLAQERVVFEIDHPDRQVVTRPPIGVHLFERGGRQGSVGGCGNGHFSYPRSDPWRAAGRPRYRGSNRGSSDPTKNARPVPSSGSTSGSS